MHIDIEHCTQWHPACTSIMPTTPALRRYFAIGALLKLCTISFFFGYRNAVYESKDLGVGVGVGGGGGVDVANANAATVATSSSADCDMSTDEILPASLRKRVDEQVKQRLSLEDEIRGGQQLMNSGRSSSRKRRTKKMFPNTVNGYAVGALRVSREEMLSTYDFGVPIKNVSGVDIEAMIIYNTDEALPSSTTELRNLAIYGDNNIGGSVAKASVSEAMEGCDTLNVIFTALNYDTHCHLLIGDFESYHINRWLRMPVFDEKNKRTRQLNPALPLRHTGRIISKDGSDTFELPDIWENYRRRKKGFVLQHFERLQIFLENVDSVLNDLRDLLKHRNVVRDNTVVVLTVNAGQSELLSNFVCAARSRGFDTGNVLVFPTDEETNKLARGLGLATYFDEKNLGDLPSEEAVVYGDRTFAAMMFAKVLCVLYVSLLGHDVLFQDVVRNWIVFVHPLLFHSSLPRFTLIGNPFTYFV